MHPVNITSRHSQSPNPSVPLSTFQTISPHTTHSLPFPSPSSSRPSIIVIIFILILMLLQVHFLLSTQQSISSIRASAIISIASFPCKTRGPSSAVWSGYMWERKKWAARATSNPSSVTIGGLLYRVAKGTCSISSTIPRL